MKVTHILLSLSAVLLAAGCVDAGLDDDGSGGMRIDLNASLNAPVVSVKSVASPGLDYDTDKELKISMIRWDEGDSDNSPVGRDIIGATMGSPYQDGTWKRPITFDESQYFRSRTAQVGFLGWYPDISDGKWENGGAIDGEGRLTYVMDGDDTKDVMFTRLHTGNQNAGVETLEFCHALSMFRIYCYAIDKTAQTEWGNVTEITLENLSKELYVTLPADLTTGDPEFAYSQNPEGDYNPVTLLKDGNVDLPLSIQAAGEKNTFTRLGAVYPGEVMGVHVKTTNKDTGNSVSIARDFQPGFIYNIYLKFSIHGMINAEVSAEKWEYSDTKIEVDFDSKVLTDLSRYGTSNSYIVTSGNTGYCFDGTVKGNGVNSVTRWDGQVFDLPDKSTDIDPVEIRILGSEALLQMKSDGTGMENVPIEDRNKIEVIRLLSDELVNGKVVFETVGNMKNPNDKTLAVRGNVLVGAFDSNGNILWSWHIWVTDRPNILGYGNGYMSLDRNLGSVSLDYSLFNAKTNTIAGICYQWGRKDPMMRSRIEDEEGNVIGNAVSVAEAHRNPGRFYYDEATHDWTTDSSPHLWGWTSNRENAVKTMYDPCPPGYKVNSNSVWEEWSDVDIFYIGGDKVTSPGYEFRMGQYQRVYYPRSIMIHDHGEVEVSDVAGLHGSTVYESPYVYQYSATPYVSEDPDMQNLSYHFRFNFEEMEKDGTDYNSLTYSKDYSSERFSAYPVRCVSENSAVIVDNLSRHQSANSYVTDHTGYYEFDATKRGNGVIGLVSVLDGTGYREFDDGLGPTITAGNGLGEVNRVDVLWWQGDLTPESEFLAFVNGEHSDEDIDAKCPVHMIDNGVIRDGKAMMYVYSNKNTYGNVGLAAYDVDGNILWTWHIWIQPGIRTISMGSYNLMDRNLGATYAPTTMTEAEGLTAESNEASCGFFYQWGRKDPFFRNGHPWFHKSPSGTWSKKTGRQDAVTKKRIQDSVKEPLNFYSSDDNFWQTVYTDAARVGLLWGYTGSGGFGDSFAKTMWDPCPPGYKVMSNQVFKSANICDSDYRVRYVPSKDTSTEKGFFFTDGVNMQKEDYDKDYDDYWNTPHNGYGTEGRDSYNAAIDGGTVLTSGLWLPNAAYLDPVYGNQTSSEMYSNSLWTAAPQGTLCARMIYWGNQSLILDNNRVDKFCFQQMDRINKMADGRNVRCVKD